MLAIYLSPVYILLNFYILRWLLMWMNVCGSYFRKKSVRVTVIIIYSLFATSVLTGFLIPSGRLSSILRTIGYDWLGVMLYALLVIFAADLIRLFIKYLGWKNKHSAEKNVTFIPVSNEPKSSLSAGGILIEKTGEKFFRVTGAVCVLLVVVACIAGSVNARVIRSTNYDVKIDKEAGKLEGLKIVLAADLHMGYQIGCDQMEQMVRKINEQEPDIVMIAGDIFDNEYEALDNPERLISILQGIQSKYGTYACYGNHDVEEKTLAGFTFGGKDKKKESDPQMDEFLKKADITLLMDEGVLIDNSFYLYGRPDYHRPGRGIKVRRSAKELVTHMDSSKPIIVMDHEPKELDELADAGVDLDLCGHTHDGQTFPGNLTIKLLWENAYGYLRKGDMHNIVTSGVGVFGPFMRLGTKAEICVVNVEFE